MPIPDPASIFLAAFAATLLLGALAPRLLRRARRGAPGARAARAEAAGGEPPAAIHLELAPDAAWRHDVPARRLALALEREGFVSAGTFTVRELPGLVVQLLVHEREGLLAAVHEHAEAGHWIEVVRRALVGDATTTWSTAKPTGGLRERTGHARVHLADAPVDDVMRRVRAEARLRPARPARRDEARAFFERRYAEQQAWLRRLATFARAA